MKEMHIMVDLETLGNDRRDGVILSIGAVVFNPKEGVHPIPIPDGVITLPNGERQSPIIEGNTFYAVIDIASSVDKGLKVEGDTLMWWMDEKENPSGWKLLQETMTPSDNNKPFSYPLILEEFSEWIRRLGIKNKRDLYMWSHGSDFDLQILRQHYEREKIKLPWMGKQGRDTRTLNDLYADKFGKDAFQGLYPPKLEFCQIKHHALHDAYVQAIVTTKAYRILIARGL